MSGQARVVVTAAEWLDLEELASSARRDEADRARAVLLSTDGWSSQQIASAFGVTADSVRRWRSWFKSEGVAGLRASPRPGREAVKSEHALAVVSALLVEPVTDRPNWTLPRLQAEIAERAGLSISKSQLSKTLKKGAFDGAALATVCSVDKIPTPLIAPGSASSS